MKRGRARRGGGRGELQKEDDRSGWAPVVQGWASLGLAAAALLRLEALAIELVQQQGTKHIIWLSGDINNRPGVDSMVVRSQWLLYSRVLLGVRSNAGCLSAGPVSPSEARRSDP